MPIYHTLHPSSLVFPCLVSVNINSNISWPSFISITWLLRGWFIVGVELWGTTQKMPWSLDRLRIGCEFSNMKKFGLTFLVQCILRDAFFLHPFHMFHILIQTLYYKAYYLHMVLRIFPSSNLIASIFDLQFVVIKNLM